MEKIKTKIENPNGLHKKYYIQKVEYKFIGNDFFGNPQYEPTFTPVEEDSEYFVLRLDNGGGDKKHIEACRIAVLAYADAIKDHLPELSKDIIERYQNPDLLTP